MKMLLAVLMNFQLKTKNIFNKIPKICFGIYCRSFVYLLSIQYRVSGKNKL
jgi:hypothetical protein